MDWFSTIAALTGSEVSEKVDGKNLMPIIQDANAESQHQTVNWQLGGYDDETAQWAVRKGPWKLIGNVREPRGKEEPVDLPELFLVNLEEDISEQKNLAESQPKKLDELLGLHKNWLNSVNSER